MEYAGFLRRLVAYLIDAVLLYILQYVVSITGLISINYKTGQIQGGFIAFIIIVIVPLVYFVVMESSNWQATLGKKAIGIQVTDLDGDRISLARALGRYFAKFLSVLILMVGFLMAGWTDRKQALHDMVAGTLVIRN